MDRRDGHRRPRTYFIAACLLLFVTQVASGQTAGGALIGRITDEARKPLPGVEVTATHVLSGFARTIKTSPDGRYRFPSVPVGSYELTAEMKGFATVSVRKIDVLLGVARHVDVRLKRVEEDEQLTVTAPIRVVESGPAINIIVRRDLIADVPLRRRDAAELAILAPLADPRRISPVAETILDGATAVSNVPLDAVEEINATTRQYSAEYGRTSGGVMLLAPRKGRNELDGEAFGIYRDSDDSWQWGASAGGAIVPDTMHAFGAVDRDPIERSRIYATVNADLASRHYVDASYSNRRDNFAARDLWLADDRLSNDLILRAASGANEMRETLAGMVSSETVGHDWTAGIQTLEGHGNGVFAQDAIVFRKTVLNVGMRYDSQTGVSPRIGWTYDINGSGRNLLRASVGRYHDPDSNDASLGYSWQINPWIALNGDVLHTNGHDAIAVSGQVMFSTFISMAGSYTYSNKVLANDDAHHSAAIAGTIHLPAKFWISGIGRYRSAPFAGDRFAGTDVRFAKTFEMPHGLSLDAFADIFDLFDQNPGRLDLGRAKRLGVRVNF
jgi:hypothetical protein